jgi:hypothetical protein
MKWPVALVLPLVLLALVVACGEEAEMARTRASASTSTVSTAIADTPAGDTDPWLKIVPSGQTQTREGLTIRLEAVAIGAVEDVLGDAGTSTAELGNEWRDAKAVVAVALQVYNPTTVTITVPIYTNTRLVANDEQRGIDFLLSDVEVSILPSVREDMQVIAPISRYAGEDIETVRFVLEMSVLASPEETFDFMVAIP